MVYSLDMNKPLDDLTVGELREHNTAIVVCLDKSNKEIGFWVSAEGIRKGEKNNRYSDMKKSVLDIIDEMNLSA